MTEIEIKKQAEAKAAELAEQLNTVVHALVFRVEEDDFAVGFIKEPSRQVKLAVLDKSVMGGFSAASEMLDTIVLKEHSDPRITSERPQDDKIYLGAVMAAYELIKFSVNTFKKK